MNRMIMLTHLQSSHLLGRSIVQPSCPKRYKNHNKCSVVVVVVAYYCEVYSAISPSNYSPSSQVEQLDDGMVFYLASLPCNAYQTLSKIYDLHADGKLKGRVPRSKKGITAKSPDLKGSNFKVLRGVNSEDVLRLLIEVKNLKISLGELASECTTLKLLTKVQAGLVKGTNCSSWEEVVQKYPKYCTAEQLEPFTKLNFSKKTLPDQFLRFCQYVIRASQNEATELHKDNIFCINGADSTTCIFWKQKFLTVESTGLSKIFQEAGLEFLGFRLSIFDVTDQVFSYACLLIIITL